MPSFVGPVMADEPVSLQHISLEDQPQAPKGVAKAAMNTSNPNDLGGSDKITNGMSDYLSKGLTNGAGNLPSNISVDGQKGDKIKIHKFEPIAVIGLASKFPQGATSSTAFWRMLMEGKSALTDVPKSRFNIEAFYQTGLKKIRGLKSRGGHFIQEDLAGFDGPFFSMAPAEIACMDPQQRWLLETAYEALENAGIPMEKVAFSKTSVHIGSSSSDYQKILSQDHQMQAKYTMTGIALSMLANRISWFYNFTGPSVTIDTACSSSLTALHTACQSIHSGDSTMGLVGGCNLCFDPDNMVTMADLEFLSPDSKCYSFDSRANGFSRGEGFGIIIIKALSKALEDGDTIRAIIRATGVNQDGRTPGITQPSSESQESLIRKTYEAAGLDLASTRYFEAHGTGTPLGDPLEASAINSSFGAHRSRDEPLYIGAVKSNIGRLEGASGIAGLIKTILVLENGVIPPNIWFDSPNPKIPLDRWNIKFPQKPLPWPNDGLRRASVNSFGFGGANAHAILDDASSFLRLHNIQGRHRTESNALERLTLKTAPSERPIISNGTELGQNPLREHPLKPLLFLYSASEESGLQRWATVYKDHLRTSLSCHHEYTYLLDLAYTLSEKRSSLPWKSFVIANSISGVQKGLETELSKPIRSAKVPKVGFIFTGQGAQWYSMGRELFCYTVFEESLEKAEAYFRDLGSDWLLTHELLKDQKTSRLDDPDLCQPICTALQIALVELLRDWGVQPSVVVGHSSGEIAAAYCAGAISRDTAWKLAYYRGVVALSLIHSNKEPGAMMSVGLSEADVEAYLSQIGSKDDIISVACINSPRNVTLSGSETQISLLEKVFERDNVWARKLTVNVAYHSRFMNEAAFTYHILIGNIRPGEPASGPPTMFSSVTGDRISHEELTDIDYWVNNMIFPVKFMQAMARTTSDAPKKLDRRVWSNPKQSSVDFYLEIGPHRALQGPIRDILNSNGNDANVRYDSMLVRGRSALDTALHAAGSLISAGYPAKVARINGSSRGFPAPSMLTNLPAYPFNHTKKYWLESRLSRDFRFRKFPHHELLGTPASDCSSLEARWRNIIRSEESPWIKDHKINGAYVYPGAGMLVMAIEAARQNADPTRSILGYHFKDVLFQKALIVPATEGVEVQFYLRPNRQKSGGFLAFSEFRLCVYEHEEWSDVCQGAIAVEYIQIQSKQIPGTEISTMQSRHCNDYEVGLMSCNKTMDSTSFYKRLGDCGINLGATFQTVKDFRYNDHGETTASIDLQAWMSQTSEYKIQPHVIHPAALDAIFHPSFAGLSGGKPLASAMIPTKIRTLWISTLEDGCWRHAKEISHLNQSTVKVYGKSKTLGFRNASFHLTALNIQDSRPCLIGDIEATSINANEKSPTFDFGYRRLCYNLDWKPDLSLLDNDQISLYCSTDVLTPNPLSESVEKENRLACFLSLVKANKGILFEAPPQEKSHLLRYRAWMKDQLSIYATRNQAGFPEDWENLANNEEYLDDLYKRTERNSVEGQVIVRVGRNLGRILSGEIDALELLFSDDLMDDFYRYSDDATSAFEQLHRYLDAYSHKKPSLKILELGSGTGGATRRVLHTLSHHGTNESGAFRFSEYVFTDISPSFFENAKRKFSAYIDRMAFSTLNIENDPMEQGFEAGRYDLVIASNVLHATASLENSLNNARKLLKPGGKLVLYELIEPEGISPGFFTGLLPGWWLASRENRNLGPLMTEKSWHDTLSTCNFSGVDVALRGLKSEKYHVCSAMVSTNSTLVEDLPMAREPVTIVTMETSLQLTIAKLLVSRLGELGFADRKIIHFSEISSASFNRANCIFLPELEQAFLHRIDQKALAGLQRFVSYGQRMLWVTSNHLHCEANPANCMAVGLLRCLQGENTKIRTCTLSIEGLHDSAEAAENILKVYLTMPKTPTEEFETEYMEKAGVLGISRVIEAGYLNRHVAAKTLIQGPRPQKLCSTPERPLKLAIGSPGLLDTLQFVDDILAKKPVAPDEVELKVMVAGLNFRDVLIALGQDVAGYLGMECAGIISQAGTNTEFQVGDRVCCIATGSLATHVRCKAVVAFKIPEDMTFTSAAAVLIVYTTAYLALIDRARIKPGESILIHSGAGGLGQACLQLARLLKAEIYVTVGSDEKRDLLMNLYDIPKDHIFSSRTPDFANCIHKMTKGRGVDVVVNSLAGEALNASWGCVAPFGRFLETGRKEISSFGTLSMFPFSRNAMFFGIDLFHMYDIAKDKLGELIQQTMALFMDEKLTPPSPVEVWPASQIEDAFRYMQSGKSKGKIVIEFDDDDMVPAIPSVLPTYSFDANATYLISGGLGGIGRSIARWMASRNAKHLILLSRSGVKTEAAQLLMDELKIGGVRAEAPICDVSDIASLASALAKCDKEMPPIKGCIQGSMILKDVIFDKMSLEQFHDVVRPKVDGSWNLHTLLPSGMDFFILLSSLSGVAGLYGQSNYACGNTYQDGLAQYRVARGEKAISLDLGNMMSVGYVAEREGLSESLQSQFYMEIQEIELHAILDYHCNPDLPLASSLHSQVIVGVESPANLNAKGLEEPFWMHRPMFSHLYEMRDEATGSALRATEAVVNYGDLIRDAECLTDVSDLIIDGLRTKLAKTLDMEKENIDMNRPMHTYGVDSLTAVEVRTWFHRVIGADVTVFEILGNESIASLGVMIARKSRYMKPELMDDTI